MFSSSSELRGGGNSDRARGTADGLDAGAGTRFTLLACAVIVVVASLMLTYEITEPFWGIHDFNCVFHSIPARNFLKHGFAATHFMPAINTGDVPDGDFALYVHHPPAITYFLALFYGVFGETEWVGRLFFVLCAIGSALLVFAIGRVHLPPLEAFLAAMVFTLFPGTAYFGRMINHESPGLFFALLAFLGYCRFLRTRSNRPLILLYLSSVLGLLTCWQDYLLPFAIAFHYLVWGKRPGESRWRIFVLPVLTATVFVALLGCSLTLVGGRSGSAFGGPIGSILKLRIGSVAAPGKYFTFVEFLGRELTALDKLFTPVVSYAAAAWLVILVVERIRGRRQREHFDWLVLCFLAFGISYLLVFKQQAYHHDYLLYYTAPAFAYASVLVTRHLIGLCLAPKRWVKVAAVVLLGYLFLVAGLSEFFELHSNPPRSDWIDLGKYLRRHIDSDEAVILSFRDGDLYTEYYSDREILRGVTTLDEFQEALDASRNEVVVYMDTAKARASAELSEFLQANYVSMPIRVNTSDYVAFIIRIPERYRRERVAQFSMGPSGTNTQRAR